MTSFKGRVIDGRLVVDAETDLPEGADVQLLVVRVLEERASDPPPTVPMLEIDPFYAWAQGVTSTGERVKAVRHAVAAAKLVLVLLRTRYPELDGPSVVLEAVDAWLLEPSTRTKAAAQRCAFRLGDPDADENVVLPSGEALAPWASHACWSADHAAAAVACDDEMAARRHAFASLLDTAHALISLGVPEAEVQADIRGAVEEASIDPSTLPPPPPTRPLEIGGIDAVHQLEWLPSGRGLLALAGGLVLTVDTRTADVRTSFEIRRAARTDALSLRSSSHRPDRFSAIAIGPGGRIARALSTGTDAGARLAAVLVRSADGDVSIAETTGLILGLAWGEAHLAVAREDQVAVFASDSFQDPVLTLPVAAGHLTLAGDELIVSTERSGVVAYSLDTGDRLRLMYRNEALCLASAGEVVIWGDFGGRLRVRHIGSSQKVRQLLASDTAILRVAAGGNRVVWADRDGRVGVVQLDGLEPVELHRFDGPVSAIAIDASGIHVAASSDGVLRTWILD